MIGSGNIDRLYALTGCRTVAYSSTCSNAQVMNDKAKGHLKAISMHF